ncbi:predicted thioesterase [Hahella chejuensis KCTC 2396]|uniref:Predicted thioesterase n=1 Tax=Hahella chejuensis (strain KCTC 2396) TaxID=349521 RepID=Q2SGS0_HAHCH|nr:thioesterase family protein [Hahella chejuensis]ABC30154.1 predicted thioesterase [Hahella chejuensis KCTC 2396]
MSFTTKRTILFGDCDPAGIVYTPRVSYFVIEAVHEFLTHKLGAPGIREILDMGILPPARAFSMEFLAPMAWDETISIEVRCKELTTTSFSFFVEARNHANEVTFRSTLTQVAVSPETKRPVPLPPRLRGALSAPY